MKIINKLITFPNDVFSPNDDLQESNYEIYTEIMEYMFDFAGSQTHDRTAKSVADIVRRKRKAKDIDESLSKLIFDNILEQETTSVDDGKR